MNRNISTIPQLSDWLDSVANNEDEWSIKFGFPNGKSSDLHVFRGEVDEVTISIFKWKETIYLRKLLHYGSNAKMRPVSWEEIFNEFDAMIGTRIHMEAEYATRQLAREIPR